MKTFASIVVSIFLVVAASSSERQSALKTFPAPQIEPDLPGLEKPACVTLDRAAKICQGLTENTSTGTEFVIFRENRRVFSWQSVTFLGATDDYQVFKVDLDADKTDELVVAARTSVGNGMGVSRWTIAILPFEASLQNAAPTQFEVEDFSRAAMFAPRRAGAAGFDLLTTDWHTLPVKGAKNRDALYFVGRWMNYANGRLEPLPRPVLARRFRHSFERERTRDLEQNNADFRWLDSTATEKLRTEPLAAAPFVSEADGAIEDARLVEKPNDPGVLTVALVSPAGERLSLSRGSETNGFDYIGDFKLKKLYPADYSPNNPNDWLRGRIAKLTSYAGADGQAPKIRILWLVK